MRFLLAGLAVLLALRALPVAAACQPVTSPNDLCAALSNPCFIDGKQCPVVSGTTLDFGTRNVVLRQGTALDVGAGNMTIVAGSVEMQPGTALLGAGGMIVVHATQDGIRVLRSTTGTRARIDVRDPAVSNRIELVAAGTIQIDGVLDARGTNTDGAGGSLDVAGTSIVVSGDLLASGGPLGIGGAISLDAAPGNLVLSGVLEGFGGSGGLVDLGATGSITANGTIDIRASGAGGEGGLMTVSTDTGAITLGGKVFMQGDEGTIDEGGASGGDLSVTSGGALTLSAAFELSGAPPDGEGGDIFFMSVHDTVQTGLVQAQGRGSESDGGAVQFDCHGALTLGPIDVHGAETLLDSGGGVTATSWCDMTFPASRLITAEGDKGTVILQAGGQMTLAGTIKSGGSITLEYLSLPPVVAGATLVPPTTPQKNETLNACPVACDQAVCGNGTIECAEGCDDHNTTDGDGCHHDCTVENLCGDGRVDSAEQCDPPNPCGGCSASCQFEACGNGMLECGEGCDDGNQIAGDGCEACRVIPAGCGDGDKTGLEECDDGNTTDGDGCSHECRTEACGNGTVDAGEDCDDRKHTCGGCAPNCKFEVCGNGVVDCGEECDDGEDNGKPGGSCLPEVCQPGPICSTASTDACIPCGASTDCDPTGACGPTACMDGVCTAVSPPTCDDGLPCNGTETCDPASGCVAGSAPACSGEDACMVYGCEDPAGCVADPLPGYELPKCRIGVAAGLIANAASGDISSKMKSKLTKKLTALGSRVLAAEQAGGNVKKVKKALKVAGKQLKGVIKLVTKQRGKKIGPSLADAVLAQLSPLPPVLTALTP
jgi:cysteine-rich repeat protein